MCVLSNEVVLSKSVGWKPRKTSEEHIGGYINMKRNQKTNYQTNRQLSAVTLVLMPLIIYCIMGTWRFGKFALYRSP